MDKKLLLAIALWMNSCRLFAAESTPSLESIAALAGNKLLLTVHAKGDQVYLCALEAGDYTWKWQAPDAKLFDSQTQKVVGSHGAGPSWEYQDGSSVKAKLIQKADAPDNTAIPWLLLEITEHKGQGLLTQARHILRINTQGGTPPSSGCDANHLGAEKRIPYSADYNFYSK